VGLGFLLTFRVVELCSSRLDPVEAGLPLAFLGYGGFYGSLFVCFLLFWQDFSSQVVFFGGLAKFRVVGGMFFGLFFHLFSSDFGSQICSSSPISD
jgi:hypothetical protein